MTLDVFLESAGMFDRDAVETALAANGLGPEATLETPDGGSAEVSLDDDSCGIFIQTLTPQVAYVVFDVARRAHLAILPVDGTPTAIVVDEVEAPDELEPLRARTPTQVCEALRQSVTRRQEAHGARSA